MHSFIRTLILLVLMSQVIHISSTKASNYCVTSRHVHLSTRPNASNSIIISFSSEPCEALFNLTSRKRSSQAAVLIGKKADIKSMTMMLADLPPRKYNATIYRNDGYTRGHQYFSENQQHVIIEYLEPDMTYFYQCIVLESSKPVEESTNDDYIEDEVRNLRKLLPKITTNDEKYAHDDFFHFRTAPRVGNIHAPVTMAIIGDVGLYEHSRETLKVMANREQEFDTILLVGDMSYANGHHKRWDSWFDMMDKTNLLRKKALYIVAGNHDAEGDLKSGKVYQAFENRFLMPQVQSAILGSVTKKQDVDLNKMYQLPYDFGNSFYTYNRGMVHTIVLNSFADFEPNSKQYSWLLKELQGIDRKKTPWLVISFHCPIYNTFSLHSKDPQPINMKLYLEPLFVKYRVSFILSGHIHAYSRSHPVAYGKVNPKGPIHIVLGNGGRQTNAPFRSDVPEEWVAIRDHTTYGYGLLKFINSTVARYEWIQTGHNRPNDKGKNFLNVPKNMTDMIYIKNQIYL